MSFRSYSAQPSGQSLRVFEPPRKIFVRASFGSIVGEVSACRNKAIRHLGATQMHVSDAKSLDRASDRFENGNCRHFLQIDFTTLSSIVEIGDKDDRRRPTTFIVAD